MHRFFALLSLLLLPACGGSAPPEEHRASGDTLFTTAGDESATNAVPEPISTGPAPLPLPTPPVPRGAMSAGLQEAWTLVEETLAVPPPSGPRDGDPNAENWVADTLPNWLQGRLEVVQRATAALGDLGAAPLYERAIAAALLGYLIEDTVADVRGMPIPGAIASDPELLTAYREALGSSLSPIAEQAASGYQACAASLDRQGDPAWGEWRAFCFERAEELEELYGAPVEATPTIAAEPSDATTNRGGA